MKILIQRFFIFEKLLLWSFKTSNRCIMTSICFIFCFCLLFLHLFLMQTENQSWRRTFLRKCNKHLRFWENLTSTLDFDKITAMNRQIFPLNNTLFSLFRHSFKVYWRSKFLNFTLHQIVLISIEISSMRHWVIKMFPLLVKDWLFASTVSTAK